MNTSHASKTPRRRGAANGPSRHKNVPSPRKKRPSAFGRVLKSFVMMTIFAGLLAAGGYFYLVVNMKLKGPLQAEKTISIKRGLSTSQIASRLEAEGVVSDSRLFLVAAYAARALKKGSIKAGEYRFEPGVPMKTVLANLRAGKTFSYKLTIPEGLSTPAALARIRANEVLTGKITLTPAEGSLLPDTYFFGRGETRDKLIRRMQDAQTKLLRELWPSRAKNLPIKNAAEAVILASIVEKETGIAGERPRVAAAFLNRLRRKIRLQSDPTIIYGITLGKKRLERPLTKKDIAGKTAWNTYQIDGLPPSPIANPGRAALRAVLNPATTNEIYFVADGTGGHAFAATLKDHEANVRKWRLIERQRRAAVNAANAVDKKPGAPAPAPPANAAPAPGNAPAANGAVVKKTDPQADQPAAPATQPRPALPVPSAPTPPASTAPANAPAAGVAPAPASPPSPPKPANPPQPAKPAPPKKPQGAALTTLGPKLKPGSVFKSNGRLSVIPRPRPAR